MVLCILQPQIIKVTAQLLQSLVERTEAFITLHTGIRRFVGDDVRVSLSQIGPPFLGSAKLVAIGDNLALQKTLRTVHFSSAGARGFFREDRQKGLHHVLGRHWDPGRGKTGSTSSK